MGKIAVALEGTVSWEVYQRWLAYSVKAGVVPDPYRFWRAVLVEIEHYSLSKGGLQYCLAQLRIPPAPDELPYVWRDKLTGAWRLRDLEIRAKVIRPALPY